MSTLLQIERISKAFPGVRALTEVSFSVGAGEVVALVGQNGSGKSTLVKVLAGYHDPDDGLIKVRAPDGQLVDRADHPETLHCIHQDLGLVAQQSTVENLDISRPLGRRAFTPLRGQQEARRAREIVNQFGLQFDVNCPVGELAAAERTIVAMARALDRWTSPENVLVVDEATATLHEQEVRHIFEAVRAVARQGAGVIYISHRLEEIFELCSRVVVLRDGRVIADVPTGELDQDKLIELMSGRRLAASARHTATKAAHRPVLSVRLLRGLRVQDVSFEVDEGEVLGVAGLLGSGREEIGGLLFGAAPRDGGSLMTPSGEVEALSPRSSIARGIGYVPADRAARGAVMTMSVRENLTLPRLGPVTSGGYRLSKARERTEARHWIGRLDVRPDDPERAIKTLSGGNQQKVVLAKWLRNGPSVLILDEPTQGVDVAAKAAIYDLIDEIAAQGTGVLVASSETKELQQLCDRVLVLRDGRVVAELHGDEVTQHRLEQEVLGAGASPDLPSERRTSNV
jgi:ABC-type sugar transport system ATPase subunit